MLLLQKEFIATSLSTKDLQAVCVCVFYALNHTVCFCVGVYVELGAM